jgi:quinolinate synthase
MQKQVLTFQSIHPLSDAECVARIRALKAELGDKVCILGHHYQRDEVYQFADQTGDSLKLAYLAAESSAPYIVFCGVHFMAEVADIVTKPDQQVILPDMAAGCSMADMANLVNVERCWKELSSVLDPDEKVTPITYVNSSADLKAFCGRHGGNICTSSNAAKVLGWAFERREKVLFFPDQHLGRNTGYKMGIPLEDMALWDFKKPMGGLTAEEISRAKIFLWNGWCSVHQRFSVEHIEAYKAKNGPEVKIVAHPEAPFEVCQKADYVGATSGIIEYTKQAPPGTHFLVATELNLVKRLHEQLKSSGKIVQFMAPTVSMCSTMYRIDPQHLLWVLENLARGNVVNRVQVPEAIAKEALEALNRMFFATK